MIAQLRQRLLALQRAPGVADGVGTLPLGISAIDAVLGGGLMRGALHEIAAPGESHLAAVTGFALGLATSVAPSPRFFWIVEDMALAESGALHGAGFEAFGLTPERQVTVSVAHRRDLLWAMEEVLRCRAVDVVIGEIRNGGIDDVAVRRLSHAAARSGALALLLRASPSNDASTAATRWIVRASQSAGLYGPGAPRFDAQLVRNRRGPIGSWILEWSESNEKFILATHALPVATPALDRSHRQVA
jgi:protein ImuA